MLCHFGGVALGYEIYQGDFDINCRVLSIFARLLMLWVWLNRLEIALRCPIERLASDGERLVVLGCVLSALIGSVGRRLGVS